jgi:hypothetical protein
MSDAVRVFTASSSATAPDECAGHVLVSGSYGGEYNAWHAAKRGLRGVILNDAGVGYENAGINGLPYLDRIGLPAATVDAFTGRIADAEDMLGHGIVSHVNSAALALGIEPGDRARTAAERMRSAPVIPADNLPGIEGGKRYTLGENPASRR